ncbi:MAG: hypothetical protein HQM10_08785 [Candidatus Riflebacteria bacterium]|nr:hypothetical protein [Candidatus Riflebacteria bacterium]
MKKRLTLAVIAIMVLSVASAYAYGYRDLQDANYMKDRGDFWGARNLYERISSDIFTDREVKREAAYFIGYCDIRLSDPWRAISSYRHFLNRFDNGNTRFVPDALFVLGRTYEDVRDFGNARYYYNEVIRRFGYGEFPEKARDRLRIMGGGYYPGPHYSMQTLQNADTAEAATVKAEVKKSVSDPFVNFSMDQNRISRVNTLISAVEKLEGVEEAVSTLSEQDSKLEVVKDTLKTYQEKQKFESLHEVK